jgi:ATP-dependent Clp protease protease subunit
MEKFWNWSKNEDTGERVLRMDGIIAETSWWGDEITPAAFLDELQAESGDITIWLNSPGGDCVAASRIYAMLMDYKGNVTVKIDGAAFSAASVVAMAGTRVLMAPTALMMIHNPWTVAIGDSDEMLKASAMLDEVKEAIMNAYQIRTGMSRTQLSNLMDAESFFQVGRAMELGFADGMLEDEKLQREPGASNYIFSRRAVQNSLMDKVLASVRQAKGVAQTPPESPPQKPQEPSKPKGIPVETLEKRLSLISNK